MGYFRGITYCLLWYSSIFAGYALLFCPLLPFLFLSNKLYRTLVDVIFTFWQLYPTALLKLWCQCDIQVSGDAIKTDETSLLIMNHRTRTDWNFLWPTVYQSVRGKNKFRHSTKFVLKDIIRHVPGPGWVMQMACFVYIKRKWKLDREILRKFVSYFGDLPCYKYSLVLFPEGTDFTPTTKQNSDNYAEENNLEKYYYILHPRKTGFTYLAMEMLKKNTLDAIYDITLVYPDTVPQTEIAILSGNFPKQVKLHLARYPLTILPRNEVGLKTFLEKRWLEKEKILREYTATGHFLHGAILECKNLHELYVALIFWTLLPCLTLYLLCVWNHFRYIVIWHTVFVFLVNVFWEGFHNFEISLYNCKKKYLPL